MALDMLAVFPPELCLKIFSYLFCGDLSGLHALSRRWHTFMKTHAELIYHNAAVQHRFVDAFETPIEDTQVCTFGAWQQPGFKTWQAYCAARCRLERNWAGLGHSATKSTNLGPEGVWRIKVDETDGIAVVSSTTGGIVSLDLRAQHRPVWSIPKLCGYDFAHVEYDNGFLLFNREDGAKEVWRRATDFSAADLPTRNGPDTQMRQSARAATTHPGGLSARATPRRGVFAPWGVLQLSLAVRCYRFVYPDMLLAAPRTADVYDVRTMTLVRTLGETQAQMGNMHLRYVDLNTRHVFICFAEALHVFDRRGGQSILKVPVAEFVQNQTLHRFISSTEPVGGDDMSVLRAGTVVLTPHDDYSMFVGDDDRPTLKAVHVSECGRHLAVLLSDNRVALLEDFERLLLNEHSVRSIATTIVFNAIESHWSTYLAYTNGRVGVASLSGIMVITLDPLFHGVPSCSAPDPMMQSFPHLRVASAGAGFDNSRKLRNLSCLQLSQTALFFPWTAGDDDDDDEDEDENGAWLTSRLCVIDMMPPTKAMRPRPDVRGSGTYSAHRRMTQPRGGFRRG